VVGLGLEDSSDGEMFEEDIIRGTEKGLRRAPCPSRSNQNCEN
jgi:hypothetical protein